MAGEKIVSISFRVTAEFKSLLALAAEHEQRSQTNLLEKLLFDYCREHRITAAFTALAARSKGGA
ncbi:MAG: hypothetical protein EON54_04895 [Alcaligenaceae bacterium]|nr:MAG: hypothetical protein EON54_04895 [Alcaligenaceae bacterium]